ncbi:MAG: toll/interleukin-1 receptor domain-containing protein, partial [Anaerolineae bacterium]
MCHAFISYCHKDSEFAHQLADELESREFSVWIDRNIEYGSNWTKEIQESLDSCGAFIVVMTPNSFASDWVQKELARALHKRKQVFPILL